MVKTNSKPNSPKPRPQKPIRSNKNGSKINEQRSRDCRQEGTGPRSPKK